MLFFGTQTFYAQLGFCSGNSGSPIFIETFGTGLTDGFALPPGTTNYFDWDNTTDHTIGDVNGKAFIVNASFTAGEFYRRTINGLCENTSYEFSVWLINLLPASRCGNNLAIDDIVFKSCGDAIIVEDTSNSDSVIICSSQTPYSTSYTAIPDNSVFTNHFYQWQQSTDGVIWTDILFATNQTYNVVGLTTTTYYRAKVAEFAANLNNSDCMSFSDIYEVNVTQAPSLPTLECWETATFNNMTCLWEVTGTHPMQPNLECWETAIFNNATCIWDLSGTQPAEPAVVNCWDDFQFNNSLCQWENVGDENDDTPIIETVSSDGASLVIIASNTGDFEYSVDGVFYQSSNVFFPLEGGQYTIYTRNSNGCGDTITLEHLHFFIPSFFTSNGDNRNETFDLKGIEFYESNEVYIFDRYGKLLKSSKNQPFKWNGTFNGQRLPTSDYWYIIIEGQRFAGHFTLKR